VGTIGPFTREKLVVPILLSDARLLDEVLERITQEFGPIDFTSGAIAFDFTSYYEAEMGGGLTRYICSIRDLVEPERLWEIKSRANSLEGEHTVDGKRKVNIDPGLLSLKHLILASTKDNGRRVPLQNGILAEITLVYYSGDYHPIEWTYPDYATREYRDVFCKIREIYRGQLKHEA